MDPSNDPALTSWVESANDPTTDFPVQNLPYGRFRAGGSGPARIGVAIGDQVLDLRRAGLVDIDALDMLMAWPPATLRQLRRRISSSLCRDDAQVPRLRRCLVPMSDARLETPCHVGNYTDFYSSIHHATNVGRQFRPDQPLLPNYKWVPIGYHGRASSIGVSSQEVRRPFGQVMQPGETAPRLIASRKLDYELEIGAFISTPSVLGSPVPLSEAESHLFGLVLLNDWSARDIQAWEYQPLGPFLAKNFATAISPWIVTLDALSPFRAAMERPVNEPPPLPYLESLANRSLGGFDIHLEVWIQTAAMRAAGEGSVQLSGSNFRHAYWSIAQLVTHHTVSGCNLQTGDLLGSGTVSGPEPGEEGSLLELSAGGRRPFRLPNGEVRSFLEDGDTITMRAYCQRPGYRRVGFGECVGEVMPARQQP
jgi:fumarylacetoacetase